MRYLYLTFLLTLSSITWAQYSITDVNYDNPNLCQYDYKEIHVVATHPIGMIPSLGLDNNSFNGYLDIFSVILDSTSAAGGTSYFTFQVGDNYTVADNAVEQDSLLISLREPGDNIVMDQFMVNDLMVSGYVSPTLDLSSFTFCSNSAPIDISNTASVPGGTFSWADQEGPMVDAGYMIEYDLENGGEGMLFVDYNVTNPYGCSGFVSEEITVLNAPEVTISTTSSTCENADGAATATIVSDNPPFDVYWSTGLSEAVSSTSSITNASSGVYYANVTDANGCTAVGTAHISDSDISVTHVISPESCIGMNDGLIDLTVNAPGNITETFWSNGSTVEDMVGKDGEYSVEIHTDNNCNFFGTYVIPNNDLRVSLDYIDEVFGCGPTANPGTIYINTYGGTGNYTWSWKDATNTEVSTMENLSTNVAGPYTCTVTDDSGCSLTWSKSLGASINVGVSVNQVTKEDCGESNGAIDVNLDWGTVTYWQWSNGATTEDLVNVPAGKYTLEVRDNSVDECPSFIDVTVPNTRPYQPQICLLTVDTSLIYNQIVWEKDPSFEVDGFNIYRETTNFGEFEQVASIDYDEESYFIDNAASPVDRSWRYYITTYDACGESYGSYIHKTIHIVVANTDLVTYDLAWDDYEGITYSDVDLMRYNATDGWQTVATLPAGTNTYTDTPSDITDIDYMVSFNLASPCTSTNKAQDHNASRSNKSSAIFNPGGPTDLPEPVTVIENETGQIMMYPNPTTERLNIYVENHENFNAIRIVNVNGQEVYNQTVNNSVTSIPTADFSNGVYVVQIISDNGIVTQKIIKE